MIINKEIIQKIRDIYGEAFYLLDSNQFKKNYIELKENFSKNYSNFNIAYSYKTNYIPKLCQIVNELGGYAEVVSEMELQLAIKCGVDPKKIIWNGPIKNIEVVKQFLVSGGTVNIDSIIEAEEIQRFALTVDQKLNIGIRCNYDVKDNVISRFGIDVESVDFEKILNIINKTENMHLINLQCHFAKRELEYWNIRVKGMVKLLDKLKVIPQRIDLGGGLYGKMEESLKAQFNHEIPLYKDYAKIVGNIFTEYFKNKRFKPELIIEPGSALVGDCMKFVGTVKTIKCIRGKYIASILGSQKNIGMSSVNPPINIINMFEGKEYSNIDLVGFTCIENDVLYKNYSGRLSVNDAIVISNCGSYSLVMKPPFILPNFPVLDISNDKIDVIKRAETFNDIFQTFNF
ncbi:hypothetical protein [Fusobacterium sp.]|uniref:hypothetical protein n=1 Tax=Fusobacterium sp. TaxID=68766 RepID=UPI002601F286|nr:hypothetical protein [Fusobacterium sp.]